MVLRFGSERGGEDSGERAVGGEVRGGGCVEERVNESVGAAGFAYGLFEPVDLGVGYLGLGRE